MHSIEIDHFLRQPEAILSKPSFIQAYQSSKARPDTSVIFAKEKRKEHLLRVPYVM